MSIYVFLGPTLPVEQARAILDATYLAPVAMGDVYALMERRPKAIAIIDGVFQRVPAVWHKEILFALAQGVRVFGSSSMGALRAAELHTYGMEGIGQVFESYRNGQIEDDDEVAVAHATAEHDYRSLSTAMVNIRAGLQQAEAGGLITAATHQALCDAAKAMFYPDRTWPAVLAAGAALGVPAAELAALNRFVRREMPDVKRSDALQLLQHLARMVTPEAAPHQPGFRFEPTSFWLQMTREIATRHGAALDNGSAHTPIVDLLPEQVEDLWDQCRADPILRQALDQAGTTLDTLQKLRIEQCGRLANAYRSAGSYDIAQWLLLRALAIAEQEPGADDSLVVELLNNLGVTYKYQGRYDEAERCYWRALPIAQALFGVDHPEVATLYHNLGGVEHARGRYTHGEPFARRAVTIRVSALGEEHAQVAADKAALAAILDGQGNYTEAEQLYHEAALVFERNHGPNHHELAVIANNLAAIAFARDDYATAEHLYRRSLAIKEQTLGASHPDVGMTLNNLAVLYKAQGLYGAAEQLYQKALAIFRATLRPEHPSLVTCQENLAQLVYTVNNCQRKQAACIQP